MLVLVPRSVALTSVPVGGAHIFQASALNDTRSWLDLRTVVGCSLDLPALTD